MFEFPIFTFPTPEPNIVELPIGAREDCYEIEDWLIKHDCKLISIDVVFHKWELPNEQTKVQFLLRWS